MRRVNYLFVRTGAGGHKQAVSYQLPGGGSKLIHAASQTVGIHLTPGKWAEVRATALEVSAIGQTRTMWFGGRHYIRVSLADQRLF